MLQILLKMRILLANFCESTLFFSQLARMVEKLVHLMRRYVTGNGAAPSCGGVVLALLIVRDRCLVD